MALRDRVDEFAENFKENAIIKRAKLHFADNKDRYIVGASVAGITWLITRGVSSQSDSSGITGATSQGITVTGKKIKMRNVSFISVNRKGPPSWPVQCVETGEEFMSQRAAEMAMGLTPNNVSKQLAGKIENANGYHFKRSGFLAVA